MSDKLLTLKEAAECLRLSEKEVRDLANNGKIPAYHVGGIYLRFKEENIFSLRGKYGGCVKIDLKKNRPEEPEYPDTFLSGIKDFFYFNDFYLISAAMITFLIYVILKSIG
jgi:excisionase family DNA binding protein